MYEKSAADAGRNEAIMALQSAKSFVVTTHERPDGDALGSLAGLCRLARALGKTVYAVAPGTVPEHYRFLFDAMNMPASPGTQPVADPALEVYPSRRFGELADAAESIVVVDTCSYSQLESLADPLRARKDKVVVLDHHATFDEIGSFQWNDPSAAAAGVMVCQAVEALNWPMNPAAAQCLLAAVVTDTGWMRFSNTDGQCLRTVAWLLDAGARLEDLYARLFQSDRPSRLRLMARMLGSLQLHCQDRLAVMCISGDDFAQAGASPEETENLINEALRIGSVQAVALLTEMPDCIRVSFRSRDKVNVAAVAARFGGGGHARAAGARMKESLLSAVTQITKALAAEF